MIFPQPSRQTPKACVSSSTTPVILKVNVQGVIGIDDLTRHKFQELLTESREKSLKNDRVKAILLCIDSPGGTVSDADGIYNALKAYKKQFGVPVYAYVDGLCASGGMYIACAADKIYASDASLVGSIGVLFPAMFNFVKLMEKVGVDSKTLIAGKGKDEMNPFRTWKPDEGANYQKIVDDFYEIFVDVVVVIARMSIAKSWLSSMEQTSFLRKKVKKSATSTRAVPA